MLGNILFALREDQEVRDVFVVAGVFLVVLFLWTMGRNGGMVRLL